MVDPTTLVPQLRITVNSRCQKACFYCRPAGEGSVQFPQYQMSNDEIVLAVEHLARHGITDVKLTGGDPAIKSDIVDLVRRIKGVEGIQSVHLVTRHARAGVLAAELADAGLDCLNFSLDTLDARTYRKITGVGGHGPLLEAIKAAAKVSRSVKINTVVMAGVNDHELDDLIQFAEGAGVDTLKLLDLIVDLDAEGPSFRRRLQTIASDRSFEDLYYPLDHFATLLHARADASSVSTQPGGLGHPMTTFKLRSGLTVQIKDARRGAWYSDVCQECALYPCHDAIMALRLTTEGGLQRCLVRDDNLLDLLAPLREGDRNKIDAVIQTALCTYSTARFLGTPPIRVQILRPLVVEH